MAVFRNKTGQKTKDMIETFAKDVNEVLQWIVSSLYGAYVAANVLKWYWWRFNGNGFFFGRL